MTPAPTQPPPQSHGPMLPVVAVVLAVIGLCLPPLLLLSGALGIYGTLKATREPAWAPRKQLSQLTMAVSGAGLLIFLGLALPNFKRLQMRVRQMECRQTLAALYAAEVRFYAKEKRYATRLEELDWRPGRGRDLLRLAQGPLEVFGQGPDPVAFPTLSEKAIDDALPKLVLGEVGLHGDCPACELTMLCATQLDGDPAVDVWTVSTLERTGNLGEKIAGGIPWCDVDDVDQ